MFLRQWGEGRLTWILALRGFSTCSLFDDDCCSPFWERRPHRRTVVRPHQRCWIAGIPWGAGDVSLRFLSFRRQNVGVRYQRRAERTSGARSKREKDHRRDHEEIGDGGHAVEIRGTKYSFFAGEIPPVLGAVQATQHTGACRCRALWTEHWPADRHTKGKAVSELVSEGQREERGREVDEEKQESSETPHHT